VWKLVFHINYAVDDVTDLLIIVPPVAIQ